MAEADDRLRDEVLKLITAKGPEKGTLKGAALVRFAQQNPESALGRKIFADSGEVAAMKHRLTIARTIIRTIITFNPEANRTVRALISVPSDRTTLGAYRPVEQVQANPRYRGELIEEALAKIGAQRRQYGFLPELDPLWARIDQQVAIFREEIGRPGPAG